jgi:hypothetical protein
MKFLFGKRGGEASVSSNSPNCVIPAWSAGIQVDTDVSGSILADLDAGYPCRHDEVCIFICSRQQIKHFVGFLLLTRRCIFLHEGCGNHVGTY